MIGKDRVFIIAEAGVNHNGSMILAKQLIDAAQWAGVDAVKFQTWKTENVITRQAEKPKYQKEQEKNGQAENQYEMLKKLELSYESFAELKAYCDEKGILFMSTADEYESAMFLNPLQPIIKVGSAELTDWPFLRKLAHFQKPIILSTGMASMEEVSAAVNVIHIAGLAKDFITVLHANTEYPTPFEDVNMRAMVAIKQELNVQVGYSDHTRGIEVPVAAVVMGARVIEKHFTLDRNLEGPDHQASLEPYELQKMVEYIRNIELAMGNGIKAPSNSERKNIPYVRKSIVAKTRIRKGDIFTETNMTVKRPGTGISPIYWDLLIDKEATKDYEIDDFISEIINVE